MFSVAVVSGCKGGDGSSESASNAPAVSSAASANAAPTISGSAPTTARPSATYSFVPTASDADGDALSFQIQNKPSWATFSTVTGQLSGTPPLGAFADIIISASDGKGSAALSPFSISVSAAAAPKSGITLSWVAPTQNSDGSALTNLAGYIIAFGKSEEALSQSVRIDNPSVDRYVFDTLPSGTYFFGLRSISSKGDVSELSRLVRKVVS
jgi:hypothetical protein